MRFNNPEIPREITRVNDHDIKIIWKDGEETIHIARDLRLACPCALCVEEMSGRKLLDPDTVPDDVQPKELHLVGRYALKVEWSDGHDTGIYTYLNLRKK